MHLVRRFHAWPEEALVSVARRFLTDVPLASEELREQIAQHMAFAHQSVTAASRRQAMWYPTCAWISLPCMFVSALASDGWLLFLAT